MPQATVPHCERVHVQTRRSDFFALFSKLSSERRCRGPRFRVQRGLDTWRENAYRAVEATDAHHKLRSLRIHITHTFYRPGFFWKLFLRSPSRAKCAATREVNPARASNSTSQHHRSVRNTFSNRSCAPNISLRVIVDHSSQSCETPTLDYTLRR